MIVIYRPVVRKTVLRGTRVKTQPLENRSQRTIAVAWRKGSVRGEEFTQLGEFIKRHHAQ